MDPAGSIWNLPNRLTVSRLILSLVLFGLLAYESYAAGTVLFVVAASTDWLDGYFARKYGLVTQLGRILDPFVDKIIVCGTFIFLSAAPGSRIAAWMTTIIVGRELLVTALRSYLEQQGADFSAQMSGKLKMVLQCLTATASLVYLTLSQRAQSGVGPPWAASFVTLAAWGAVLLTVYSGWMYVVSAWKLLARR